MTFREGQDKNVKRKEPNMPHFSIENKESWKPNPFKAPQIPRSRLLKLLLAITREWITLESRWKHPRIWKTATHFEVCFANLWRHFDVFMRETPFFHVAKKSWFLFGGGKTTQNRKFLGCFCLYYTQSTHTKHLKSTNRFLLVVYKIPPNFKWKDWEENNYGRFFR